VGKRRKDLGTAQEGSLKKEGNWEIMEKKAAQRGD